MTSSRRICGLMKCIPGMWHRAVSKKLLVMTSGDIHPPLYYITLKFWIGLFSDSIFSMRALSVLLSILSIFFIYRISKLFIKSDLQIILILLLYAVSPLNIYYSQEVRMLNLNLFLCLGSVYYFYCFINSPSNKTVDTLHCIYYSLFIHPLFCISNLIH